MGSEESGEAFILDPQRDVSEYFAQAQNEELSVADSHQHNDYVSGICEFAPPTPVELLSGAVPNLAIARGG